MDEVVVRVEAEVNPTESEEKVRQAIANIFGDVLMTVTPSYRGGGLLAEARGQESLVKFRNLLRSDRIRDAARRALFHGIHRGTISFCLNKQVAFAGHVSFSEEVAESPLGPIKVTIACDDPRGLVDWLAPRTA
ncbi:hypothetical protein G4O51_08360 [Candidatus Bathyarchaeota archaeon A05DMB-2]|jgi:predicted RNA binding protein with dsRBD fold (UPF0201 family)|nr:hypothetical protein [Candidatus Bathyarchaeota archaeon A05DMB-2]